MGTVTVTPDLLDAAVLVAGDTIQLAAGDYTGPHLLLPKPVTVVGLPGAVVRRQLQPVTSGVTLRGLDFRGPFQNGAAVYGLGAPGLVVDGCTVTGADEQSIMLDRCDDGRVTGCHVHDSGADAGSSGHHGIYVANSRRVTVERLRVERVPAFGLQIGPRTHDSTFRDCTVDGCGQYGVTIWGGSSGNTVAGCSFRNTAKGVATSYQAGQGNIIEGSVADRSWPTSLAGVTLRGNTVGAAPPPPPPPAPPPPDPCAEKVTAALAELRQIRRPGKRVLAAIRLLGG